MALTFDTAAERLWTGLVIGTALLIALAFWLAMRWGFGAVIEMSAPDVADMPDDPKAWQIVLLVVLFAVLIHRIWAFGLKPLLWFARLPVTAQELWGMALSLWWKNLRWAGLLALPLLALGLDLDMPWMILPFLATVAVWEFVKDRRDTAAALVRARLPMP